MFDNRRVRVIVSYSMFLFQNEAFFCVSMLDFGRPVGDAFV